eukprot:3073492-Pleurochrysis_carterae.AAC.1
MFASQSRSPGRFVAGAQAKPPARAHLQRGELLAERLQLGEGASRELGRLHEQLRAVAASNRPPERHPTERAPNCAHKRAWFGT